MSQAVQLKVATEKLIPNLAYAFTSRTTFVKELMQNANRAGSSTVSIWTTDDGFVIEDDGIGITNMQDLLTVAESGWDESVKMTQKPFGIGWLSALFAADWVCVSSNGSTLEGMTADILNFAEIDLKVSHNRHGKRGTRVELRGIKATEGDVIEAAKKFAKGFPVPVELNGVPLPRPHAQDNSERTWIQTAVGTFSVPGIREGKVKPVVNLYLQGFSVGSTSTRGYYFDKYPHEQKVVLHLDSQMFCARLPDREVLIDQEVQFKKVEQAFLELWSDHLLNELARLGGSAFLDVYTQATEMFSPELFEYIPFLPASWLEKIVGVPDVGEHPEESGVAAVTRHLSKTEIEAGQITIVDLDDPEVKSSDCPLWLYAAKAGFFRLAKNIPTPGHWAHEYVVALDEWEVEASGEVIASCNAWLPETAGGTFRLVDHYSLAVSGRPELPTFVVEDETLWTGEGFWIPVKDPNPGNVVCKISDFTDQNGSYQDDDEGKAYSRMEGIVLDLKCPNPADVLLSLIRNSDWQDFPSLRTGKLSFTVTLDRDQVSVTEEPVSQQIVDGLFDDALSGLKEYYPKLLDAEVAGSIRESVRKYFSASGNQQTDYERVRDMIESIVK